MILLLPRDQSGAVTSEGCIAKTEIEAWKKADSLLLESEQAIYVSLYQLDMTLINELWKTEFYQGWILGK